MPEQQNIEYKQSWHDDYLKWVCRFSNAQAGVIFLLIRVYSASNFRLNLRCGKSSIYNPTVQECDARKASYQ